MAGDPWIHPLSQDLLTTFPELHLFSLEGPLVGELTGCFPMSFLQPLMDSLELLAKADDSADNLSQSDDICS